MGLYEYMRRKGYLDNAASIQSAVNSGPNGSMNGKILEVALNYMLSEEGGWEEIDPFDLIPYEDGGDELFPKMTLMKYITNGNVNDGTRIVEKSNGCVDELCYNNTSNRFRSGGWILEINKGDTGGVYVLYKPHKKGQPPIPLQLSNVSRFFIQSTDKQRENAKKKRESQKIRAKPVYFARPTVETDHPVYMKNGEGVNEIVYYARDKFNAQRFKESKKCKQAKLFGWFFD